MDWIQLAYLSEASAQFDQEGLVELVAAANRHNTNVGVTGALYFGGGRFLQILEGDQRSVLPLYARILEDPRHARIHLITIRPIHEPAFPEWGMGMVTGAVNEDLPLADLEPASGEYWVDTAATDLVKWFRNELTRDSNG